ncbi:alpha/beta hydrolase family protein [Nocardia rhizosphaerihabitans]|uniref:Alpha/beta hydrolase n=1 Tax=Nocardia rhizosphaerihabitans TaxID=1691570 RepID=A0ABQ2K7M6_9NOCA|nr:alpha/beta fold hydrolase [Nocardia rhizosphaerihabitans]GGN71740.1 alpha/beta hydrolase [Nocardia rhizosphaerihabitans]
MRTGRVIVSVLFVVAALVTGCSSDEEAGPAVQGPWHGDIEVPGQPISIGVTFAENGSATIDIPVQGVRAATLKDVRTEPDRVEFTIPDVPGDPGFRGKLDGEQIAGDWVQSGQTTPLVLHRGQVEGLARPQDPKPPYPYRSEDVTYRNGDITIAGTLTEPEGTGPFPAILLITGSGPQDRDEDLMGHRPFLLLADTFTRAGYAVLRTDDRGVGGTSGKLDDATYADLAGDAAAGVAFLRDRPEIDPAKVGLFGHSEGGYLAPLVAARPDSNVAFAVLMAGPSVVGADVLIEQNKVIMAAAGEPQDKIDEQVDYVTQWSTLLRSGDIDGAKAFAQQHNDSLPAEERAPQEAVDSFNTPYMASFITYDPKPALEALRIPVLAFFGEKDQQVLVSQNEEPMRANLAGDPDATVYTFPGLNHLMQPTETGKPSEYATIETTIDPAVLTYVTDWLTQHIPPR